MLLRKMRSSTTVSLETWLSKKKHPNGTLKKNEEEEDDNRNCGVEATTNILVKTEDDVETLQSLQEKNAKVGLKWTQNRTDSGKLDKNKMAFSQMKEKMKNTQKWTGERDIKGPLVQNDLWNFTLLKRVSKNI